MALSDTACEAKWTRTYLSELGLELNKPTIINGDNTAANNWAENSANSKRAKQIDIRAHFVKYSVLSGQVSVRHVNSEENEADGFTKTLDIKKFELFRKMICVHQL